MEEIRTPDEIKERLEQMSKSEIIAEFGVHEGDTGSPEVQIALLTARINHLNEHLNRCVCLCQKFQASAP